MLSGGAASSGTTTLAAGGLSYKAHYDGSNDPNYNSNDGICENLAAEKLTPEVSTAKIGRAACRERVEMLGSVVQYKVTVSGTAGTPSVLVVVAEYTRAG